jgi:hypothetical protein
MIVTGTLVSLAWLLHGIIINSVFIIVIEFDKFTKFAGGKLAALNSVSLFSPLHYFTTAPKCSNVFN